MGAKSGKIQAWAQRGSAWAVCAACALVGWGCVGEDGARGFPGEPGAAGEQGAPGPRGEQGEQGEQGVQGDPGERGPDPSQGNVAPIARDDKATTRQGQPVVIRVLDNDADPEGLAMGVKAVSAPLHGSAQVNGDGSVTYSPGGLFSGGDTFTYTAVDVFGAEAEATVEVQVFGPPTFRLTVFHNNDGESGLLGGSQEQEGFGGVAPFLGRLEELRQEAEQTSDGHIMLSSGDNFLAGPEFAASLSSPEGTFYDALALELIGYDAIALGNHDFDFGPELLADFIGQLDRAAEPALYLNANLDFSGEPRLQAFVDSGRIAPRGVVDVGGVLVGIVGATTESLPFVSSPRNVRSTDVEEAVQAQIDALTEEGVGVVVLISHLQSINEEVELAGRFRGVDVIIAGGGDELLANPADRILPGEEPLGPYPIQTKDADGNPVLVVTGEGAYRYIGRLVVDFDAAGHVVGYDEALSGPQRVTTRQEDPDAVEPNRQMTLLVTDPVQAFVDSLDARVAATTLVGLNGLRNDIRTRETNLGDLVADAFLWRGRLDAPAFGVQAPDVALYNAGGIRNNNILGPGTLSELDTFDVLPFANFLTLLEDIPVQQFKEVLENSVSQHEDISGRFAQLAGVRVTFDLSRPAQVLDEDSVVVTEGQRVRRAELIGPEGEVLEVLIDDGAIVAPGRVLTLATGDFAARGGDEYPFRDAPFTVLGVTDQLTLLDYLTASAAVGGLGGTVRAERYPEGGLGRIVFVE